MEKSPKSSRLLDLFLEEIDFLISKREWNKVIEQMAIFVGAITNDPKSVGILFSSSELDQACKKVALAYQSGLKKENLPKRPKFGTLIFITEAPQYGGHISVLRDLINCDMLEKPITILATNYLSSSHDSRAFINFCHDQGVSFLNSEFGSSKDILEEVQNNCNKFSPKNIVLMGHNHDALTLISGFIYDADHKYFIHHGDHHLCLGAASSDFIHVDLTNWSFKHCRDHVGLKENCYIPLVITDSFEFDYLNYTEKEITAEFITCTSGRSSKFIGMDMPFEALIARIIKATNGYHIHIGEISPNQLISLNREFELLNIDYTRFINIKFTDSLSREWIQKKVKIYLSSFPITGAKSNIEAMSLGLPIVLFDNPQSRILSGIDFTYPQALIWVSEMELINLLQRFKASPRELFEQSAFSKEYYLKYHSLINLKMMAPSFLLDKSTSFMPPLNPKKFSELNQFITEKNYKNEIFVPIGEHKFRDINEENGRLKQKIIDFNQAINEEMSFKDKYFEVLNTLSWKITQPLRNFKSALRSLKNVLKI